MMKKPKPLKKETPDLSKSVNFIVNNDSKGMPLRILKMY